MRYKVTVQYQDQQEWHSMVDWCWKNVGNAERFWKIEDFAPLTYGFKKKGDAVLFALKWL